MLVLSNCLAMFVSAFLVVFQLSPYLFVANSVPGHLPLAAAEAQALLAAQAKPRAELPADLLAVMYEENAKRGFSDWQETGKGAMPRALLAKLLCGQELDEVNAYLLDCTPWSVSGSTWRYNDGDYDFTEVILTTILYRFGDQPDRLYPETRDHLLKVLLVEEGGRPKLKVPNTAGRVFDTENHILMTESSRYLKNQWLRAHGSEARKHDNQANGLEEWLIGHLNFQRQHGFYEFNSVPYQIYAMHPLMNLEAFAASPVVQGLAREILDINAWICALGSLEYRQSVPFRRQEKYLGDMKITSRYDLPEMLELWSAGPSTSPDFFRRGSNHLFIASALSYRPPLETLAWAQEKPGDYLLRVGHPEHGSPEIFSGGPNYLLSAGGAYRGRAHKVVPRPTVLLLKDDAPGIKQCFHIKTNEHIKRWNNTGVYHRFACGAGPVHVPEGRQAAAEAGGWACYAPKEAPGLLLATYSSESAGLMLLFPEAAQAPEALLETLQLMNPDPAALSRQCNFPGQGLLRYDLEAAAGVWVMQEAAGKRLDRAYDTWALVHEFSRTKANG